MAVFSKLAAIATIGASLVCAVPVAGPPKLSTHLSHTGANGAEFMTYHPPATYETFLDGASFHADLVDAGTSADQAAITFLANKLGVATDSLEIRSGYAGDTATHVYISQKLNGIAVANGVANVVFNKSGKIVAYGANLLKPSDISSASPKIDQPTAIAAAEKALGGTYNEWPVKMEYVYQDTTKARLAFVIQVQNDKSWFEAFVDAQTGEVINVIDFVAHASYRVVPWKNQDPTVAGFSLVTNPQDTTSSPNGWHQDSTTSWTTTRGNNVISYKSSYSATTAESASGLVFDFAWSSTTAPTTAVNLNVARTNAFFIANSYHDLLYKYGFTEKAFNFQDSNFGKGGAGADNIEMSVQASGTDNSNFATPADGQKGHCNMYLWDYTNPERDGDLSNDVITHEFTHGLTNRMTGGGTGRCLSTTEAGGMGEGWSDTLSFWTEQKNVTYHDYVLGVWVYDNPGGIRSVPYSTSLTVDPHTYATVAGQTEVHDIGEVWATMLIEVYWALVAQYGYNSDFTAVTGTQGNIVFLHLLVDALPLQPCSPTFLAARNAIILADTNRYAGANKCLLWKAFAKRGLGVNAANYKNDSTLPSGC